MLFIETNEQAKHFLIVCQYFSCPKSPAEHKSKKMHFFFVYDFFYNQK